MADLATLKRRRGRVKASLTKLATKLRELEETEFAPSIASQAQQYLKRLETLDANVKTHHLAIVDVTEEEEQLTLEQEALDQHDDDVMTFSMRLQVLSAPTVRTPPEHVPESRLPSGRTVFERRLTQLQARIVDANEGVSKLSGDPNEVHLVHLYQEQLADLKRELSDVRNEVLAITTDASDSLSATIKDQDVRIFQMLVKIKKLLYCPAPTPEAGKATPGARGVKLPKIDVPTFSGDLLHWQTFWEQFDIAINDSRDLSTTEKLVYLRHALKDGSAKTVIEGLSHTGDQYEEAIASLRARYDRPRLIHQAHVKRICEVASLKEGTGRELRQLHDTVQQHLRALKAMGQDPTGSFITSLLELKMDSNTMFEWQKASQDSTDVPHYTKVLAFLNLRAQASETCSNDSKRHARFEEKRSNQRVITSFAANASDTAPNCSLCKGQRHPLYACPQFKSLTHDRMLSMVRTHNLCLNCLRPGHMSKSCGSNNRCRRCQKPHHTLLHNEAKNTREQVSHTEEQRHNSSLAVSSLVTNSAHSGTSGNALLMTCQLLINAPDGSHVQARGLLDSDSSTSFVSERLAQSLGLRRSTQNVRISGVAGIYHGSPLHSTATFTISPLSDSQEKLHVSAIVVPRVTCDLPVQPVYLDSNWNHLSGLQLADPGFGQPNKIDILLGIDVYASVVLQGRRNGPPGTPVAFETKFGWVLAGKTNQPSVSPNVTSHHVAAVSGDDIIRKFWEIEESPKDASNFSPEERLVMDHFAKTHTKTETGRFMVPLPKNLHAKPIGESRCSAVRRFLSLERSLNSKDQFEEFAAVMQEYTDMKHAEPVPAVDLHKPSSEVFYLLMHAVRKNDSTTTKLRVVFDASAKSNTGVSLNDTLLVGPTVHSPLIEVLLRFRTHRVALTTDVSKMYRAVELTPADKDLHRFVWRNDPKDQLVDYRMTRVTFGVSASSFAANMSVKQNALDHATRYPLAARAVHDSFYVDDGLTGADSISEAIELQNQLQDLFATGGFLLRKWNSSESQVIQHLSPDLRDVKSTQSMPSTEGYTKTLGIQWNVNKDHFKLSVAQPPPTETLTKRGLVSDIAKTFDVLGWFSPSTIKVKVLMQQLWEHKVDWDDPVPAPIRGVWSQWRSELHMLSQRSIPRCYFNKQSQPCSMEIHGFSDASEAAYAAVVYLRITDETEIAQTSLVMSKIKVAPIKRLTIPRLELCGAYLLARLIHYVKEILRIPLSNVYAWTDSTIVLNWLDGSPKRFKTYVGNRISTILDLLPSDKWRHVSSSDNPADCASRGIYPSELLQHSLWWNGPTWLKKPPAGWLKRLPLSPNQPESEEKEISLHAFAQVPLSVMPPDRVSSYTKLKRVTAWVLRFITNSQRNKSDRLISPLTTRELQDAESHWVRFIQDIHFAKEKLAVKANKPLHSTSPLRTLNPFIDDSGLLRVGGRKQLCQMPYQSQHPVILHGKHSLTHLIIHGEYLRLLHASPTLLAASLSRRYHMVGGRKIIRSVARRCITCRKYATRPQPQMLGQLPIERITPGPIFDKVGVDYAGPVLIKYGYVRKPTIVKAYICIFVSLTVKAVHLELVTDLTSDAFVACLRRFIARRGRPTLIWSDNGTNFVGAAREIKDLMSFLTRKSSQERISQFLTNERITWKFIPQRSPHFGGLWGAAVKSTKYHLRRILGDIKMTYEELSTLLTQIEACLNSRPLAPLSNDDNDIQALTPGHFLIGRPLQALPDRADAAKPLSLLRRWQLCQNLLNHFWKRWSTEYVTHLGRFTKWSKPTRNLQVGDLVVLREDTPIATKWPLARVTQIYSGKDNLVRVATIKTATGTYTRPVTKLALYTPQ